MKDWEKEFKILWEIAETTGGYNAKKKIEKMLKDFIHVQIALAEKRGLRAGYTASGKYDDLPLDPPAVTLKGIF